MYRTNDIKMTTNNELNHMSDLVDKLKTILAQATANKYDVNLPKLKYNLD